MIWVGLKDMGSKMYILIVTLLPCLSRLIRFQAAGLIWDNTSFIFVCTASYVGRAVSTRIWTSLHLHAFTDRDCEKPLMVHGAGIQVAVIRRFRNRITACLECGNGSHMLESMSTTTVQNFLHELWEFMGWSKWQWYGVGSYPITACFD